MGKNRGDRTVLREGPGIANRQLRLQMLEFVAELLVLDRNARSIIDPVDFFIREMIPALFRFCEDKTQVVPDRPDWIGGLLEPDQLRVLGVAAGLPLENRLRQEGLTP